jgi:putative transposase
MKTSRFSNEQIAMALRQVEAGSPVEEICRKLEISQNTFYRWKRSLEAWERRRSGSSASSAMRTGS